MQTIPLFPLNLVFFPGAQLPLRIFEPRYTDLVSECLRTESGFGICGILQGSEVGGDASCHRVGTYASIIDWSQLEDGLLGITVEAGKRFKVEKFSRRENKLLQGKVNWLEEKEIRTEERFALLQSLLRRIFEHYELEIADLDTKLDNANWLSYRLAEYLPMDIALKQNLLEITDSQSRLLELEQILADNSIVETEH